jgi:MraZ protein
MPDAAHLIRGEFRRTLDDRFRLVMPKELVQLLGDPSCACILAKERRGCVSLWNASIWQAKWEARVAVIEQKIQAGTLREPTAQVQLLGRLLSTRHRPAAVTENGRLLIPPEFREFLGVEPNNEVLVIGAAVCVEIWNPPAWGKYLQRRMPRFQRLLERMSS